MVQERIIADEDVELLNTQKTKLVWFVAGLAGEAGEAINLVKKGIMHKHGLDEAALIDELGDCLWYVTAAAEVLCGKTLEDLVAVNADKLLKRYPKGFSFEGSRKRVDVER